MGSPCNCLVGALPYAHYVRETMIPLVPGGGEWYDMNPGDELDIFLKICVCITGGGPLRSGSILAQTRQDCGLAGLQVYQVVIFNSWVAMPIN